VAAEKKAVCFLLRELPMLTFGEGQPLRIIGLGALVHFVVMRWTLTEFTLGLEDNQFDHLGFPEKCKRLIWKGRSI
jgi:hypothetical protein